MNQEKIIIVGAGLCGSLLAITMAKRGYEVEVYERRDDMRKWVMSAGRSINLALSSRGIQALKRVGLEETIRKTCIPMKGRFIHPKGGQPFVSPYSGRTTDYINSVSRGGLNMALLDELDKLDNVKVRFNSKCIGVDLAEAKAKFKDETNGDLFNAQGSIVIGTDGAGSAVRKAMMGQTTDLLFNYSQDFLRHGYKELSIHPTAEGGYAIDPNALHIWPRDSYMIIALPNLDGSFTVTMFHPYGGENGFEDLDTPEKVRAFFEDAYPDLAALMPHYVEEYFENPVGTLGTIKCFPWQAYGKTLLMGDASHAIVPFYGQGMNASFEDVVVFDDLMEKHGNDWATIFEAFEVERAPNTDAIADLAKDNFIEMRDKVNDAPFIKKRKLEMQLEQTYPDYYSKYSLVTFRPEVSYNEAMVLGRLQDEWLLDLVQQPNYEQRPLQEIYTNIQQLKTQYAATK